MKKNTEKKLKISKKTVATLNRTEMDHAKGGNSYVSYVQACGSGPNTLAGCPSRVSCRLTVC